MYLTIQHHLPRQLLDGRRVWLRPIRPDDAPRLQAFHRRLSPRSRRLRFFTNMRELQSAMAERFANVDFCERAAFVACDPGQDEIRGVGRYEGDGHGSAEVAFVIEDGLQGRGLGFVLLQLLADQARACGIRQFTAQVLPENRAMLCVFRNSGFPMSRETSDGVATVTLDLTAAAPVLAAAAS